MSRRGAVAALAAMTVVAGAALPAAQQAVFRATVNVVAVDVTVSRGRTPVTDLGPQDFVLLDNGVRQEIDSVSRGTMPLDVTVVIDLSGSTADAFPRFMTSAAAMQQQLGPEDRWRWLGIFAEPRELLPMRPAAESLVAIAPPGSTGGSAVHDTVFLALVRPGEPERRHMVVVFTDGNDNWSTLDPRQLPGIADKADAVLHIVVSDSPPGPQREQSRAVEDMHRRWRDSQDALFDAARRSGGGVHRLTDRAEAFARIIEDFRSAYVLRYTPRGVDAPGWHELAVSVTRPGSYAVRARKGYERESRY